MTAERPAQVDTFAQSERGSTNATSHAASVRACARMSSAAIAPDISRIEFRSQCEVSSLSQSSNQRFSRRHGSKAKAAPYFSTTWQKSPETERENLDTARNLTYKWSKQPHKQERPSPFLPICQPTIKHNHANIYGFHKPESVINASPRLRNFK